MRPNGNANSLKERLIVEGFGGIRHLELDLNRIVLLTGPQAEGKSLCAKLLHFFKSYLTLSSFRAKKSFDLESHLSQEEMTRTFVRRFPSSAWNTSFRVAYQCGESVFSVEHTQGASQLCVFESDPTLREWILQIRNADAHGAMPALPYPLNFTQLFAPAERGLIPMIRRNSLALFTDEDYLKTAIDPFLLNYGATYEGALQHAGMFQASFGLPFEKLPFAKEIVRGALLIAQEGERILHDDGRTVPLENATSGQKQAAPFLVILKRLLYDNEPVGGHTLYAEEPEANLFPDAQRALVQLLVHVYHQAPTGIQLVIPTHSPYILAVFNNLMEAGLVRNAHPERLESLTKLLPETCILDPADVTAYTLGPEGAVSLMNPETGLIGTGKLDAVSDELEEQFNALLELEFE